MTAEFSFRKALIQLDLGTHDLAENNLKNAIDEAAIEGDLSTRVGATCSLGELLFMNERFNEAKPLLEEIANLDRLDDVFDREQQRAKELLEAMAGS